VRHLRTSLAALVSTCSIAALATGQEPRLARPTSTLVWRGKDVDIGGSLSPDGRYVSYFNMETRALALRDLATDASRTIVATNNAPGQPRFFSRSSTISRDGRQVAYSWFDPSKGRDELWIADLNGNANSRRLFGSENVDLLLPRDWSPDGQWIVAYITLVDLRDQLTLISTTDGRARVLKTGYWAGTRRAFFSPDGKYLAYDLPADAVSATDVWISRVDAAADARVVAHRANDIVMGWSPDGKQLLFTSDRTGSMALFSVEMENGTPRGAPTPIKPDMGLVESMGVSRDGALVYGAEPGLRGGSVQVAQFDLETGAVSSPNDVSTNPMEDNINPSWSPNGKYLAYVSARGRSGTTRVIVVRHSDTFGLVREIPLRLQRAEMSGWEPDSRGLLVAGRDLISGRSGSFRADVATGEVSFIFGTPQTAPLQMPTWSRDGHTLYFWRWNQADGLYSFVARHLATGTERDLVRRPFLGGLLLSPDGRFLATETVDTATNERVLLLVPTDGSTARELMRTPSGVAPGDLRRVDRGARVGPASWAPNGDAVIARLTRQPEGSSELWRVPIDGSSPRKLPIALEANVFRFAISPDGRRVAYRIKESEPAFPRQVWKLEHFIPATSSPR
jgi:Tol biopolymer transport system component